MSGRPVKRSLTIAGHRTSISLEHEFWSALKDIAKARATTVPALIAEIDAKRGHGGLSSAVRCAVLTHYKTRAENKTR